MHLSSVTGDLTSVSGQPVGPAEPGVLLNLGVPPEKRTEQLSEEDTGANEPVLPILMPF